jgi:predicted component of type VI protein secretion system
MTATVDNAVADLQRANAELRRQLDERTAERDEALDQQTATSEVLQVINSSPGDLAPVFDAMLERAMRLCEGAFGAQRQCTLRNHSPLAVIRSTSRVST